MELGLSCKTKTLDLQKPDILRGSVGKSCKCLLRLNCPNLEDGVVFYLYWTETFMGDKSSTSFKDLVWDSVVHQSQLVPWVHGLRADERSIVLKRRVQVDRLDMALVEESRVWYLEHRVSVAGHFVDKCNLDSMWAIKCRGWQRDQRVANQILKIRQSVILR